MMMMMMMMVMVMVVMFMILMILMMMMMIRGIFAAASIHCIKLFTRFIDGHIHK